MPTPSPEIIQLLSVFAIAFTTPTFKNVLVLTYGAILTPGRRTVAAALRVMGLADSPDFGKYHRVLNRARWNIEVTFEETRAHLGFETQRQWSDKAIERTTPALLGLFSLVVLMALRLHPQKLPCQTARWYPKQDATFSDALAAVRNRLWQLDNYSPSPDAADTILIPTHLFRALRHLALHPL